MKVAFIVAETVPYFISGNLDVFVSKMKDLIKKDVDVIILPKNALEGAGNERNRYVSLPYYFENLQGNLSGWNGKIIYSSSITNAVCEIFSDKIVVLEGDNKEYLLGDNGFVYFANEKHRLSKDNKFLISSRRLTFDGKEYIGGGVVLSYNGKAKYLLEEFKEDTVIIDTNNLDNYQLEDVDNKDYRFSNVENCFYPFNEKRTYDILVRSIKTYFQRIGIRKAVVGLSGGIDSAVVVALGVAALGKENVVGLLMPSEFSTSHSVTDAEQLAQNLGIEYHTLPIKNVFNAFNDTLKPVFEGTEFDVTEENIQARIRGTLVMSYANKFGAMVLNTSNKSELMVGYGTLYGDLVGSIGVIGDVFKTEVYRLANYINKVQGNVIPEHILTKAPSAELRPGQKDQDALPDYNVLDKVLISFLVVMDEQKWLTEKDEIAEIMVKRHKELFNADVSIDTVKHTLKLIFRNSYKGAQVPPKIILGNYPEINLPLLYKLD